MTFEDEHGNYLKAPLSPQGAAHYLHVTLVIGEDSIEIAGDVPTDLVADLVGAFLENLATVPSAILRQLAAQLREATDDLTVALVTDQAAIPAEPFASLLKESRPMAASDILDPLIAEITEAKTVMAGAAITIRGIQARIDAAVAAAVANGATAGQLEPFIALSASLDESTADLAAAMVIGTPAEPTEPTDPEPTPQDPVA